MMRRLKRGAGLLVALVLARTSSAAAQRPVVPWRATPVAAAFTPRPSRPVGRTIRWSAPDSAAIHRTYWLEGGIAGSAIVALLGATFAVSMCHYSDTGCVNSGLRALGGFVGGAVLGFGPGALIGGQFRRPDAATNGSPPDQR